MFLNKILAFVLFIGLFFAVSVSAQPLSEPNFPATVKSLGRADYNWTLKNLDGKDFDLSSAKGKVVVINIWTTWCYWCVKEMPGLQNLYDQLKDEVVFVFASNEDSETVNNFVTRGKYSLPVYVYTSNEPSAYSVLGIPTTFVIAPSGDLVFKQMGAADWGTQKTVDFFRSLRVKGDWHDGQF